MNKFLIKFLSFVVVLAMAAGCTPTQPKATQAPVAPATQAPAAPATAAPVAPATQAPAAPVAADKVFKIGGMAPLTGGPAFLGENLKRLFEYSEKAINDAGGINGVPVKFYIEDDMGSAAGGTTAVKKLISVDHVNAIIGPLFSSPLLAIAPQLNEEKVIAITPTSSADGIFSENGYVFSIDIRPIFTTRFQCDYFNQKGYKKLAFIGEYNDFTVVKMDQFKAECPKVGVEVVDLETYQTGATDFRTELTKIKFASPDVIFMNVNEPELVKLVVEMKGLGFDNKIALSTDFQAIQEDVFTQIGAEVDGRLSFTTGNPAPDGSTKDLIDAYNTQYLAQFKTKYNADPTGETPLEWDCINILIAAAKKAASFSGEDLRAAVAATDMRGIAGNIKFNSDGSVIRAPFMIEYTGGQQVYWKK
jgi:branched-chain amino acid transport system substrate-binding protein